MSILFERWAILEADWLREYGRDLNADVFEQDVSWRRFVTLWRGLGPQSLWRALDEGQEQVITDDMAGERALESVFG